MSIVVWRADSIWAALRLSCANTISQAASPDTMNKQKNTIDSVVPITSRLSGCRLPY
jgi:hypothetical protein